MILRSSLLELAECWLKHLGLLLLMELLLLNNQLLLLLLLLLFLLTCAFSCRKNDISWASTSSYVSQSN